MAAKSAQTRRLLIGLAFLSPNIVGVLVFVVFPVVFSLALSFSNWDLKRHNMWHDEPLKFVGLSNFVRLFTEPGFLQYLGNTLYMMMAVPLGIGASLVAAMMLSKDTRGGGGRVFAWLISAAVLVAAVLLLGGLGLGGTGMTILLAGLLGGILIAGAAGGNTVYRTLFYAPAFTSGVATFILWKKLYAPQNGPINGLLAPAVGGLGSAVAAVPAWGVQLGFFAGVGVFLALLGWGLHALRRLWTDGDLGTAAAVVPVALLFVPVAVGLIWLYGLPPAGPAPSDAYAAMVNTAVNYRAAAKFAILAGAAALALFAAVRAVRRGQDFPSPAMNGVGSGLVLSLGAMVGMFAALGLAAVLLNLPAMVADPADPGLHPPAWLNDYEWAKPALMFMGFWAAIGSNNMLLYLAALTNVPQELYEAADIDGASRLQRFWNITWPQLAPTTFFITVMSVIGGLQGGFESARTMTQGGPAGSTTTLSYFIYTEGFETGRFSFASAVAWALFLLVFAVTMFNWKFGNKFVND